tara:strand:- start:481 stop:675 length:195 start_codon:yes stop_codon:yes gene_type:complete
VAGDIIILEEAAYCDQGLISEVGVDAATHARLPVHAIALTRLGARSCAFVEHEQIRPALHQHAT